LAILSVESRPTFTDTLVFGNSGIGPILTLIFKAWILVLGNGVSDPVFKGRHSCVNTEAGTLSIASATNEK